MNALSIAKSRNREEMVRLLRGLGAVDPIDPNVPRLARSAAEIGQWLAARRGADARPSKTADRSEVDACAGRLAVLIDDIAGWLAAHAPRPAARLATARVGADPADVAALEAAVGEPLPVEVRAYLQEKGVFDYAPPGLEHDNGQVRFTAWHPGWIPFLEDSCANLTCVDLAPLKHGTPGQVIAWRHMAAPLASSIEEYLRWYRDELLSNRHTYNEASGTYHPRR